MIRKLNHVAIVVPDLDKAAAFYKDVLGAKLSRPVDLPNHGVTTIFVELENTKIELLAILGDSSPVAKFLEKNAQGGIHHLCYEVQDIQAAISSLQENGCRILGEGSPKIGAHGLPVIFLHPKDCLGTLIELEEVR